MKITVIGYWGAYPQKNEATSSYLLQTEQANILIDCGSGALSKLQNYIALEKLDAVVLSHYHADHIADVYPLQYGIRILTDLGKRKDPLPIYGHLEDDKYSTLTYEKYVKGYPIGVEISLKIKDITFHFQKNVHPGTCFCIKIEKDNKKVVYTADTGWYDELVSFSQDADMILCEASLYNENYGLIPGHMTAKEAGKLGHMCNTKKLVLTHLPHFGKHENLLKEAKEEFKGEVELANTGSIFNLY
ncbi:MBL fold metallo-hydrolase [Inediibacterium massiliense]|uniref:MBL fold metallo-hydrolase n=1 Tax=Inediibacterium massiliense TaxID=1658111 RepID=UPI0006B61432|nr:MBL fold metallo-hydrolase [Inediibacterium massiliense]